MNSRQPLPKMNLFLGLVSLTLVFGAELHKREGFANEIAQISPKKPVLASQPESKQFHEDLLESKLDEFSASVQETLELAEDLLRKLDNETYALDSAIDEVSTSMQGNREKAGEMSRTLDEVVQRIDALGSAIEQYSSSADLAANQINPHTYFASVVLGVALFIAIYSARSK
jgi:methyl-accepting chemotaxis protein